MTPSITIATTSQSHRFPEQAMKALATDGARDTFISGCEDLAGAGGVLLTGQALRDALSARGFHMVAPQEVGRKFPFDAERYPDGSMVHWELLAANGQSGQSVLLQRGEVRCIDVVVGRDSTFPRERWSLDVQQGLVTRRVSLENPGGNVTVDLRDGETDTGCPAEPGSEVVYDRPFNGPARLRGRADGHAVDLSYQAGLPDKTARLWGTFKGKDVKLTIDSWIDGQQRTHEKIIGVGGVEALDYFRQQATRFETRVTRTVSLTNQGSPPATR